MKNRESLSVTIESQLKKKKEKRRMTNLVITVLNLKYSPSIYLKHKKD